MTIPTLALNDGKRIPQVGLGTWKIPDGQASAVVEDAVDAGYRLVDTASEYGNEPGVGRGLQTTKVTRPDIMLATKIWIAHQGYDEAIRAAHQSLQRLNTKCIDLYLIHWPAPARNKYVETWRALVTLQKEGVATSIGVCNFHEDHLRRIIDETGVTPAVNQIELSPQLSQRKLRDFHRQHNIVTQSWSPLARGQLTAHGEIIRLAGKYGKTPAQIILRWHVQHGLVVIPKSTSPLRVRENAALFDFSLEAHDMDFLDSMEAGKRLGPNPDKFEG